MLTNPWSLFKKNIIVLVPQKPMVKPQNRYFNLKFLNNLFFKRYQWKLFKTITWWNTAVTNASECIGKLLNKTGNPVLNFCYSTNIINVKTILSILFIKIRLLTPKENDSITFALLSKICSRYSASLIKFFRWFLEIFQFEICI